METDEEDDIESESVSPAREISSSYDFESESEE